jgi:hypothetical protein
VEIIPSTTFEVEKSQDEKVVGAHPAEEFDPPAIVEEATLDEKEDGRTFNEVLSLVIMPLEEDKTNKDLISMNPLPVAPKPIFEMTDEELLSNKELLNRIKKLLEAADNEEMLNVDKIEKRSAQSVKITSSPEIRNDPLKHSSFDI